MENVNCQAWIHKTWAYGKLPATKCQKIAVIEDAHGRKLCQYHYNRWIKKVNKRNENKEAN